MDYWKPFKTKVSVAIGIVLGALVIGFVCYIFALTVHIRDRLRQRRWEIPSIVYSDSEILFPGEKMDRETFTHMLIMRGYRAVPYLPRHPGRFAFRGNRCRVFLRDFDYPDHRFKGFVLDVVFREGTIERLARNGKTLGVLMMEPVEIARLYGKKKEARELVSYHQIPRHLVDAVVVTEDRRFFQHRGIDWRGILRALWVDVRHGKVVQGGSTITQQLVKNYFLRPERSLIRKAQEALIAFVMERLYAKEEILEMYMNEIYMGQREGVSINGMGEAVRYYFGHDIENITLAEAALLAGLIRAPNRYSPFLHPKRAKERRDLVLKKMLEAGKVTERAYRKALNEPVGLPRTPGMSRENLYYVDFLKRQLTMLYPKEVLASQGLRIFTTFHPEIQEAGVRAIRKGLKRLERVSGVRRLGDEATHLQAAMVVVRPKTGEILALIGGRNYGKSSFNRAVDARRQPGSLFKPFVYLIAMDTFTPASIIQDVPIQHFVRGKPWFPKNYDGKYHGKVTVRTALEFSLNAATVNLAMAVGLDKIIKTAQRLGFSSELKPYPSLALGAFEMTPLELARGYCLFANEGQVPFLLGLREVVNEAGKVVQRKNVAIKTICNPAKAYLVTSMLEGVVRHGTASGLKQFGIKFPCAGKTGTTTGYRDSWFVGFTRDLLAVVWLGYDDNRSTHLTGASGAMVVWADFMKRVERRFASRPFVRPPGVVSKWVSVNVDWPPESVQPRRYKEVFLRKHVPMTSPVLRREDRSGRRGSLIKDLLRGFWKGIKDVFR